MNTIGRTPPTSVATEDGGGPPLCACSAEEPNGSRLRAIAPNGTARTGVVERDEAGRFVPGNKAALGHGGGAHNLARWRRLAHEATKDEDHLAIWHGLIECAKNLEPWAVVVYLHYTLGKPPPPQAVEQIDQAAEAAEHFKRLQERLFTPPEVQEMAERLNDGKLKSAREALERQEALVAKLMRERSEAWDIIRQLREENPSQRLGAP